ncbi:MAG TPA: hypothetical protein VEY07_03020, partial [Thermoplasmata archaeon]|nr:hypothetical protein [Thermoplasmata archaeon]
TTAASAGGYAYLASHPDANASLILVAPRGSVAASGLEWMVTYSECPPAPIAPVTATAFQANVDPVTASLLVAMNFTGPCPWTGQVQQTALSAAVGVTAAFEATQGSQYWYNFTVRSVTGVVPLGSMAIAVQNAAGTNLTLPGANLTVRTSGGSVVGTFDLLSQQWTTGAGQPLRSGDVFSLQTKMSLAGQSDWLELFGNGYFTGSVSARIP